MTSAEAAPTGEPRGIERYRELRGRLERSILPLATSVDGRAFSFRAPLDGLALAVGAYVVVDTASGPALGQVQELALAREAVGALEVAAVAGADPAIRAEVTVAHAAGGGRIVDGAPGAFHDAALRPAAADDVRRWVQRRIAACARPASIGRLSFAPDVAWPIDAGGFDRHTFLCGQSGSGKTYALGLLLERLLTETGLRIVVLDPNSDFVGMRRTRPGADAQLAERYRAQAPAIAVWSRGEPGQERLRLRLAQLDAELQAALLRLDPIADREEYAELAAILAAGTPPLPEALDALQRPEAHRLALRARNLGAADLGVWARGDTGSVLDVLADRAWRCLVVDLGALSTSQEQALTAAAVLRELWLQRERREPVLVVIDEAHNVCPAAPQDRLTAMAAEACVRIAAEGRKYGLHLLVSTQRPQKVQEDVVTQCDNLVLLRLNSRADVAFARDAFSMVAPGLVDVATDLRLGEALVAGKISPAPAFVRVDRRVSEEGGRDVGVPPPS